MRPPFWICLLGAVACASEEGGQVPSRLTADVFVLPASDGGLVSCTAGGGSPWERVGGTETLLSVPAHSHWTVRCNSSFPGFVAGSAVRLELGERSVLRVEAPPPATPWTGDAVPRSVALGAGARLEFPQGTTWAAPWPTWKAARAGAEVHGVDLVAADPPAASPTGLRLGTLHWFGRRAPPASVLQAPSERPEASAFPRKLVFHASADPKGAPGIECGTPWDALFGSQERGLSVVCSRSWTLDYLENRLGDWTLPRDKGPDGRPPRTTSGLDKRAGSKNTRTGEDLEAPHATLQQPLPWIIHPPLERELWTFSSPSSSSSSSPESRLGGDEDPGTLSVRRSATVDSSALLFGEAHRTVRLDPEVLLVVDPDLGDPATLHGEIRRPSRAPAEVGTAGHAGQRSVRLELGEGARLEMRAVTLRNLALTLIGPPSASVVVSHSLLLQCKWEVLGGLNLVVEHSQWKGGLVRGTALWFQHDALVDLVVLTTPHVGRMVQCTWSKTVIFVNGPEPMVTNPDEDPRLRFYFQLNKAVDANPATGIHTPAHLKLVADTTVGAPNGRTIVVWTTDVETLAAVGALGPDSDPMQERWRKYTSKNDHLAAFAPRPPAGASSSSSSSSSSNTTKVGSGGSVSCADAAHQLASCTGEFPLDSPVSSKGCDFMYGFCPVNLSNTGQVVVWTLAGGLLIALLFIGAILMLWCTTY